MSLVDCGMQIAESDFVRQVVNLSDECRKECGIGRGRPPWLAMRHREVDREHGESPPEHAAGSSPPGKKGRMQKSECRMQKTKCGNTHEVSSLQTDGCACPSIRRGIGRGHPPWLALWHGEVDIGHGGTGTPSEGQKGDPSNLRKVAGMPARNQEADVGHRKLHLRCVSPPTENKILQMMEIRLHSCDPPWLCMKHSKVDRNHGESPPRHAAGNNPPKSNCGLLNADCACPSIRRGIGRGHPPWSAMRHREVDVGYGKMPSKSASGISPPRKNGQMQKTICGNTPKVGSMHTDGCACPSIRRGIGRGHPPWFAVRDREVDIGNFGESLTGCRMQIAESDFVRQVDNLSGDRREECGIGRGRPPWQAVQHREADVGHRRARTPSEGYQGDQSNVRKVADRPVRAREVDVGNENSCKRNRYKYLDQSNRHGLSEEKKFPKGPEMGQTLGTPSFSLTANRIRGLRKRNSINAFS
jgi:hypothetical protein